MSDELLGELRQAGNADSEGQFTVDRAAARRKLGSYRFATPEHWTLPLLAHAVRAGAETLLIESHGHDSRIAHDGKSLTVKEMARLVTDTDEPVSAAVAALVDCVDALMALGATFNISSGPFILHVVKGVPGEIASDPRPFKGLGIAVSGARVIPSTPFAADVPPTPLHAHGRWAPIKVLLNARIVSTRPFPTQDLLLTRKFGEPPPLVLDAFDVADGWEGGCPAVMAVTEGAGRLKMVVDGLSFDVEAPRFKELGVLCVAWPSGLSVDLSYGGIIEDDALVAARDRLDAELGGLLAAVARSPDILGRLSSLKGRLRMAERFRKAAETEMRPAVSSAMLSGPLRIESRHETFGEKTLLALLGRDGERFEVDALETLEETTWNRFLDGDAAGGRTHQKIIALLGRRPPGPRSLPWLWRGVSRAAMEGSLPVCLRLASQSVEVALALSQDEARRSVDLASAYDVLALARRWEGDLGEADRLHALARRERNDGTMRARWEVLRAEVMVAKGALSDGRRALKRACAALGQRYTERADWVMALREVAELAWLEGDEKKAYTLWRHSVWQMLEADKLATYSAIHTLKVLRSLVRKHEGMWFKLRDSLTVVAHFDPFIPFAAPSIPNDHPIAVQEGIFYEHFLGGGVGRLSEEMKPFLQAAEQQVRGLSWALLSRRQVFALRLDGKWAEADRLLARRRLVMRFWPLEGTTVLAWTRRHGKRPPET